MRQFRQTVPADFLEHGTVGGLTGAKAMYKRIVCLVVFSLVLTAACPAFSATAQQLVEKGQTYLKFHRYKEAVKAFSQAIQKDRNGVSAYLNRAIAWYNLKEYDLAISDYTRAIKTRPDLFEAYLGRAAARFAQGKYRQAIGDYAHILKKEPYHPDANNQLAWLLAVCPDPKYRNGKKAVKLAERAVESETSAHYLDTLAAAYAEAGRFRDAERTQKSVIFLLMKQDQTKGLDRYVKRLTFYQKKRPWRIQHVATKPATAKAAGTASVKKPAPPVKKAAAAPPAKKAAAAPPPARPAPAEKEKAVAAANRTEKPAVTPIEGKKGKTAAARTVEAKSSTESPDQGKTGKTKAAADQPTSQVPPVLKKKAAAYPYVIQVGSYRDPMKSKRIALSFRKKGDASFTSPAFLKSGVWHRIFMGFYPTLGDARKAAVRLKKRRFRQYDIFKKPWTLQLGIFKTREGASAMERIMYRLGLVPYRIKDMYSTSDMRMLFGAFETRGEAARIAATLRKKDIDSRIVLR
jgi:tetratricopeptide (TPR) repeat protein